MHGNLLLDTAEGYRSYMRYLVKVRNHLTEASIRSPVRLVVIL